MANRKGHLEGGKFGGTHTTVIPAAQGPASAASKLDCVSKVSLGLIKHAPGGKEHRISFREEGPTCILARVRGPAFVQEVRVYLTSPNYRHRVEKTMTEALPGK